MGTKGLERTYGRGSGERKYKRIPLCTKRKKRPTAVLYDPLHAPYPQSGAYASDDLDKSKK